MGVESRYELCDALGDFGDNDTVILEPRGDSQSITAGKWPNIQFTSVIGGQVKISKESDEPISLKKNDHFCQIRSTSVITPSLTKECESPKLSTSVVPPSGSYFSDKIKIDPQGQLTQE